jgi:PAS domain S-box-containing protein
LLFERLEKRRRADHPAARMSLARELTEDGSSEPMPRALSPAQSRAHSRWGIERVPRLSERILHTAQDGIVVLDAEGRIAFANPTAARIMGYAADDLLGQPVRTHLQFSGSGLDGAMQTLPHGESLCWREDGSSFPIEYESAPLDEDDGPVGTVVTFRDISQRRAIEKANDERISVVTHELRTPLTSIRSALGLLAGGVLDRQPDKGQRMLDIAVTNLDRLIRLVNDVLDLERLDSGHVRMRQLACDVADLMRQAADGVRWLADDTNVTIEVSSVPAWVLGDPDRLLQVLTNLLSNAIKFSPRVGPSIIWLESEQAGGEVLIRVRDEGRGIPEAMLESIFERFQQVDDGDADEKGGAGLGLAICRSIVMQHDGQIWAESTVGAGTTICVALPSLDHAEPDDA